MIADSFHVEFLREAKNEIHHMRFSKQQTHEHEAASVPCSCDSTIIIERYILLRKKVQALKFIVTQHNSVEFSSLAVAA